MEASTIGNPNTKSEDWFEEYLNSRGYQDWSHEEPAPGKPTNPDYCLRFEGNSVYFDVKEFKPQAMSPGFGYFDPYSQIREKINKAGRQFKHYKEYPCAVVLSNPRGAFVMLEEWSVRGAMFGEVGFQVPIGLPPREQPEITNVFRHNGKLLRADREEKEFRIQNTTFSAVLVLDRYPIRKRRIEINYKRGKKLGEDAFNKNILNELPDHEEQPLRVSVYENPYARIAFPKGLFRGPYDERWGVEGSNHLRTWVGVEVEKLDAEYTEAL
jgi:hypothetical protein